MEDVEDTEEDTGEEGSEDVMAEAVVGVST